jgi:calcineurin-like phosphoesterase family protein
MNYWFTSDWHLSHANIIRYCNRPFSSAEEMDKIILNNFFSKVKDGDIVYHLGDLSFRQESVNNFLKLLSKIEFHMILGNHDNKSFLRNKNVNTLSLYEDIVIEKQNITICHYPMTSWNKSHYGAWHLHGHHHRNTSHLFKGKIMNVSVDVNNFSPIDFEQIKEYMNKREDNWDYLGGKSHGSE